MRGTLVQCGLRLGDAGIIPAYAGNTPSRRHRPSPKRDHPRVCGEHFSSCVVMVPSGGSSPRMRGTLWTCFRGGRRCGIIPAYAGNTSTIARCWNRSGDHPRVCGEHALSSKINGTRSGSSPRMRGTLSLDGVSVITCGDHPRVCGEHMGRYEVNPRAKGSSPRMRGTPRGRAIPAHMLGIIPAYAGNTRVRDVLRSSARDHPRVCGEHSNRGLNLPTTRGSSPRMRGTPAHGVVFQSGDGIIPAYAGNT